MSLSRPNSDQAFLDKIHGDKNLSAYAPSIEAQFKQLQQTQGNRFDSQTLQEAAFISGILTYFRDQPSHSLVELRAKLLGLEELAEKDQYADRRLFEAFRKVSEYSYFAQQGLAAEEKNFDMQSASDFFSLDHGTSKSLIAASVTSPGNPHFEKALEQVHLENAAANLQAMPRRRLSREQLSPFDQKQENVVITTRASVSTKREKKEEKSTSLIEAQASITFEELRNNPMLSKTYNFDNDNQKEFINLFKTLYEGARIKGGDTLTQILTPVLLQGIESRDNEFRNILDNELKIEGDLAPTGFARFMDRITFASSLHSNLNIKIQNFLDHFIEKAEEKFQSGYYKSVKDHIKSLNNLTDKSQAFADPANLEAQYHQTVVDTYLTFDGAFKACLRKPEQDRLRDIYEVNGIEAKYQVSLAYIQARSTQTQQPAPTLKDQEDIESTNISKKPIESKKEEEAPDIKSNEGDIQLEDFEDEESLAQKEKEKENTRLSSLEKAGDEAVQKATNQYEAALNSDKRKVSPTAKINRMEAAIQLAKEGIQHYEEALKSNYHTQAIQGKIEGAKAKIEPWTTKINNLKSQLPKDASKSWAKREESTTPAPTEGKKLDVFIAESTLANAEIDKANEYKTLYEASIKTATQLTTAILNNQDPKLNKPDYQGNVQAYQEAARYAALVSAHFDKAKEIYEPIALNRSAEAKTEQKLIRELRSALTEESNDYLSKIQAAQAQESRIINKEIFYNKTMSHYQAVSGISEDSSLNDLQRLQSKNKDLLKEIALKKGTTEEVLHPEFENNLKDAGRTIASAIQTYQINHKPPKPEEKKEEEDSDLIKRLDAIAEASALRLKNRIFDDLHTKVEDFEKHISKLNKVQFRDYTDREPGQIRSYQGDLIEINTLIREFEEKYPNHPPMVALKEGVEENKNLFELIQKEYQAFKTKQQEALASLEGKIQGFEVEVKAISSTEAKNFTETNHLQLKNTLDSANSIAENISQFKADYPNYNIDALNNQFSTAASALLTHHHKLIDDSLSEAEDNRNQAIVNTYYALNEDSLKETMLLKTLLTDPNSTWDFTKAAATLQNEITQIQESLTENQSASNFFSAAKNYQDQANGLIQIMSTYDPNQRDTEVLRASTDQDNINAIQEQSVNTPLLLQKLSEDLEKVNALQTAYQLAQSNLQSFEGECRTLQASEVKDFDISLITTLTNALSTKIETDTAIQAFDQAHPDYPEAMQDFKTRFQTATQSYSDIQKNLKDYDNQLSTYFDSIQIILEDVSTYEKDLLKNPPADQAAIDEAKSELAKLVAEKEVLEHDTKGFIIGTRNTNDVGESIHDKKAELDNAISRLDTYINNLSIASPIPIAPPLTASTISPSPVISTVSTSPVSPSTITTSPAAPSSITAGSSVTPRSLQDIAKEIQLRLNLDENTPIASHAEVFVNARWALEDARAKEDVEGFNKARDTIRNMNPPVDKVVRVLNEYQAELNSLLADASAQKNMADVKAIQAYFEFLQIADLIRQSRKDFQHSDFSYISSFKSQDPAEQAKEIEKAIEKQAQDIEAKYQNVSQARLGCHYFSSEPLTESVNASNFRVSGVNLASSDDLKPQTAIFAESYQSSTRWMSSDLKVIPPELNPAAFMPSLISGLKQAGMIITGPTKDAEEKLQNIVRNYLSLQQTTHKEIEYSSLKDYLNREMKKEGIQVSKIPGAGPFSGLADTLMNHYEKTMRWDNPALVKLAMKQVESFIDANGGLPRNAKGDPDPSLMIPISIGNVFDKSYAQTLANYCKMKGYEFTNDSGYDITVHDKHWYNRFRTFITDVIQKDTQLTHATPQHFVKPESLVNPDLQKADVDVAKQAAHIDPNKPAAPASPAATGVTTIRSTDSISNNLQQIATQFLNSKTVTLSSDLQTKLQDHCQHFPLSCTEKQLAKLFSDFKDPLGKENFDALIKTLHTAYAIQQVERIRDPAHPEKKLALNAGRIEPELLDKMLCYASIQAYPITNTQPNKPTMEAIQNFAKFHDSQSFQEATKTIISAPCITENLFDINKIDTGLLPANHLKPQIEKLVLIELDRQPILATQAQKLAARDLMVEAIQDHLTTNGWKDGNSLGEAMMTAYQSLPASGDKNLKTVISMLARQEASRAQLGGELTSLISNAYPLEQATTPSRFGNPAFAAQAIELVENYINEHNCMKAANLPHQMVAIHLANAPNMDHTTYQYALAYAEMKHYRVVNESDVSLEQPKVAAKIFESLMKQDVNLEKLSDRFDSDRQSAQLHAPSPTP